MFANRTAFAGICLCVTFGVAACSSSPGNLDTVKVGNSIAQQINSEKGITAVEVECPKDVLIAAGTTFTCTATYVGNYSPIVVTQTDAQGNFTWAATNRFFP